MAAQHNSIFPTFFLSGFECSTFKWKEGQRRDLCAETRHLEHADEDYRILSEHGFGVAREGVPWPMVDRGQGYDLSCIEPFLEAQRKYKILPIWDMCHYGYPDRLDPFTDEFAAAFANYCRAVAERVIPNSPGPHFFTPINEITFFAFIGGEWGWAAPYLKSKEDRYRLRLALCKAAIAGVNAIREVEPEARMVHVDPLILVVPPPDRPDLADEARKEMYDDTFFCWDVLAGKRHPELGGSPETLDIVGVNCYSFGQMEFRVNGPHHALGPRDERIEPLCDLLTIAWERYRRPMIIAETSGMGEGRPAWLKDVMEESLAAVHHGIDLHGVCLFPGVDMPDWHTGKWLHNGFCDLVGPDLRRVPYPAVCRRAAPLAKAPEPGRETRRRPLERPGEPGRSSHRRPTAADAAGCGLALGRALGGGRWALGVWPWGRLVLCAEAQGVRCSAVGSKFLAFPKAQRPRPNAQRPRALPVPPQTTPPSPRNTDPSGRGASFRGGA